MPDPKPNPRPLSDYLYEAADEDEATPIPGLRAWLPEPGPLPQWYLDLGERLREIGPLIDEVARAASPFANPPPPPIDTGAFVGERTLNGDVRVVRLWGCGYRFNVIDLDGEVCCGLPWPVVWRKLCAVLEAVQDFYWGELR